MGDVAPSEVQTNGEQLAVALVLNDQTHHLLLKRHILGQATSRSPTTVTVTVGGILIS